MADAPARKGLPEDELVAPGHVACQGCGAALAMRYLLKALGDKTVLVIPACCWAVIPGPMPGSCLQVPTVFSPFEATAAMASGVKAALRRQGRDDVQVVGFAGDGGTADIGIQALSGAAERGEDFVYVCYDNEAYMNTGIQRSGATPPGAWTTTTPGQLAKTTGKKDMPAILAAHNVPYVATLNPAYPDDFLVKARKAGAMKGLRYLHILADCPTGWKHDPALMVEVGRLATQSRVWPLYEVERGAWRVTKTPKQVPVEQYLRTQGRFSSLGAAQVAELQHMVDERWRQLEARVASTAPAPPVPRPEPGAGRGTMLQPSAPAPAPARALRPPAPPPRRLVAPAPRAAATPGPPILCYKGPKPCDGSCGKLLPGGRCAELVGHRD